LTSRDRHAHAAAVEVPETGYAKDLVAGSGIEFEDRGSHGLEGVPAARRLFALRG
jgi:hypothetical protein